MVGIDQIISECRQYNSFAQKLLYEMYAPKMKGVCVRYIDDHETLKDILQEGFIKVFSNIKQYKNQGSFEGWIKRIFINTAISHIRKNGKKNDHVDIENIDESLISETEIYSDNTGAFDNADYNAEKNSFELVQRADLSETELLNALKKVPEKYRMVFNMSCIENYKHEEIAEILDIDTATSRTRLLRARTIIKKELHSICIEKLKK